MVNRYHFHSKILNVSSDISDTVCFYWSTPKSLSSIWQRFLCLINEGLQNSARNIIHTVAFWAMLTANLAAILCPGLVCPQTANMKNLDKFCKDLFGYFNTLETHSEASNAQLWLVNQVFFTTTVKLRTGARLC